MVIAVSMCAQRAFLAQEEQVQSLSHSVNMQYKEVVPPRAVPLGLLAQIQPDLHGSSTAKPWPATMQTLEALLLAKCVQRDGVAQPAQLIKYNAAQERSQDLAQVLANLVERVMLALMPPH